MRRKFFGQEWVIPLSFILIGRTRITWALSLHTRLLGFSYSHLVSSPRQHGNFWLLSAGGCWLDLQQLIFLSFIRNIFVLLMVCLLRQLNTSAPVTDLTTAYMKMSFFSFYDIWPASGTLSEIRTFFSNISQNSAAFRLFLLNFNFNEYFPAESRPLMRSYT